MADVLPARPEEHPRVDESRRPEERPCRRVGNEPRQGHPRNTRRKADERAHDRQEAAEERGCRSVALEEVLRQLQLVGPDEQVAPVSFQERPPTPRADRVTDERPHGVPHGGRHDDDPEVPWRRGKPFRLCRVGNEETRVRQDELGRQWHHRRLDRHGDGYTDVANSAIQAVEEGDDHAVDKGEHGAEGYRRRRGPILAPWLPSC